MHIGQGFCPGLICHTDTEAVPDHTPRSQEQPPLIIITLLIVIAEIIRFLFGIGYDV